MSIFKQIFTTEGRLNRKRYLIYMIIFALTLTAAKISTTAMATLLTGDPTGGLVMAITLVLVVIAGAGNIMLIIRRLHDLNKSGYFALVVFVPVIGTIFSIWLFFAPGTIGYNQYGADPLIY